MDTQPSTSHPDQILVGCQDFATATHRAASLIPGSSSNGGGWDQPASCILAIFLHAAALSGRSMPDVARWTITLKEVTSALTTSPDPGNVRAQAIGAYWAMNDKARHSVLHTMPTLLVQIPQHPQQHASAPSQHGPDANEAGS